MASSKPAPRQQQKEETRRRLIEAALAEFSERGLDAPSLDRIAARAGYTRGAFYVHFKDREQLLAAVMEHLLGTFLETIARTEDGAGDLERTIDNFVAVVGAIRGEISGRPTRARGRGGRGGGTGMLPFHNLLDACGRSKLVEERFVQVVQVARGELAHLAAAHGVPEGTTPEGVASLLVVQALGVLAALEAGAPIEPEEVARALRALLRRPGV